VQRFHLERCRRYLDLAYEYDARNVLLVLGEYIWEQQVIPPKEQWQTGARNLRELGKYAEGLGVQIALELEPFRLSLVNNVDSMVRFLDEVGHSAVKANIDISHLQLAGTPPSEVSRLRGKAIHVHLSDCDGKVHGDLPPGRGVVDFIPYLKEIKALGIDGAISIELEYSPQPERIVEWVREAYEAVQVGATRDFIRAHYRQLPPLPHVIPAESGTARASDTLPEPAVPANLRRRRRRRPAAGGPAEDRNRRRGCPAVAVRGREFAATSAWA